MTTFNLQDLLNLAYLENRVIELSSRSTAFTPEQLFAARKIVERLYIDTEQKLTCMYMLKDLFPGLSFKDAQLAIDYSIQEYTK